MALLVTEKAIACVKVFLLLYLAPSRAPPAPSTCNSVAELGHWQDVTRIGQFSSRKCSEALRNKVVSTHCSGLQYVKWGH